MTLSIWRVIKSRYANEALSGEGARIYGGRWTSAGRPVIYCAQHLSLAILEILVHLDHQQTLSTYAKISISIDENSMSYVEPSLLPVDWDAPFPGVELQRIGDRWLDSQRSMVLQIPSVVVHEEFNFLVNPRHPEFAKLDVTRLEPMPLDSRLFRVE